MRFEPGLCSDERLEVRYLLSQSRSLLLAAITVLACIALHEAGHALAGWATGGRLAEIEIISFQPHVRITGSRSPADRAVRAVSGSGLVLLAWVAGILAMPRRRYSRTVLEAATFFASVEVLGWFLSAVFYNLHVEPNDASRFLASSGMDPRMTAVLCMILAAIGSGLFRAKLARVPQGS